MATWGDFQAPANQDVTSNAWTTLQNSVQQHDLILAWASHYDPYGSCPTVKLSGVPLNVALEVSTQPYRTWFPYDRWYWYYRIYGYYPSLVWLAVYYYYGYYPWWIRHWHWWHYGRWIFTGTLVIAFAEAAGTVRMEALGTPYRVYQKLRIWNTVLTPDSGQAITKVNFQRNDTIPRFVNQYVGQLQVLQDDIVVSIGLAYHPYYYQYLGLAPFTSPSPNVQVLLDEFLSQNVYWPYGAIYCRVVRVKGNGVLHHAWDYPVSGIGTIRLTPNVEERTVTFPSIPSGQKLYFEMQVIEDAFGNNNYSKEFLALVDSVKDRLDWGLFASWKREETGVIKDDKGREVFSGWKLVEIWMVPDEYYSQVQTIPNVLVLETYQKMRARYTYHEERW